MWQPCLINLRDVRGVGTKMLNKGNENEIKEKCRLELTVAAALTNGFGDNKS
jgi:hypothetical protein